MKGLVFNISYDLEEFECYLLRHVLTVNHPVLRG
jgi:hypothetical protein